MADSNYTTNVTVSDDSQNQVGVTLNAVSGIYELRVKDEDLLTQSQKGMRSEWQYAVEQGKAFSVIQPLTTIAGQLETDFMLIRNPTGNTKIMEFHSILYTYNKGSGISIVRIYGGPTITNVGTPLTPVNKRFGNATTPTALVYYAPTISARGTLRNTIGQSAVGTFIYEIDLGLILQANSDYLFSIQPAANNTDHSLYVDWYEE